MSDTPIIVLTTDFSDEAERAYEPVVDLAKRLGGKVDLVHVVEDLLAIPYGAPFAPPIEMGLPDQAAVEESARKHMDAAVRKLGDRVPAEGHVLRGERVARVVCDHAEKRGASFLAASTHGRTGLRRMVMGSVAEQLLRQAVIPLIIYPRKA
jgi:nucleotide-binding universal stress UspA family protein